MKHGNMRRKKRSGEEKITALYADEDGNIFDAPQLFGAGRSGSEIVPLTKEDLIPLPDGADLMFLPQRSAVGITDEKEILPISGQAVAAVLPPGFTRLYLPAFVREENADVLPLYGYTAVVLFRNELYAAAVLTDKDAERWNPSHFNTEKLDKLIAKTRKLLPNNRLVEHLAHCSTEWHCATAQNLFYSRFEAGVPTSPSCNANCLGCISLQSSGVCPAPQSRIKFSPTQEEIVSLCLHHLSSAKQPMVSFGQGCEGEPSLNADNIAASIKRVRMQTSRGQININTNAGNVENIKKIVDAGLQTMRVSIISATNENYAAYYRANYSLADVESSIDYALAKGVYVSLNLLYMPGFTDGEKEWAAWEKFFAAHPVNMVQIRNLNIDPDLFLATMPQNAGKPMGTRTFLHLLREKFPAINVGSFSRVAIS